MANVSAAISDGAPHYRLAKALGVLAITASALAAEYGAGINFVSVQAKAIMRHKLLVPAAIISILLSTPLILSLAVVPNTSLWFQPLFQGAVVTAIGVVVYVIAHAKVKGSGHSFREIAAQVPIE
jgi:hypothetical protein